MDLVEAFIKANKKLIIYISGMTCSGKTKLAKSLSKILRIDHYQQKSFYISDKASKKTLPNGITVVNWDSDDVVDWNKMNNEIDSHKGGLIVSGNALLNDKLDVKPDFHIHVTISKQKCLDNRIEYIKKNKDRFPTEFDQIESGTEKLKMNILTYPYYLSLKDRTTITKWLSANKFDEDQLIDESLSYLFAIMKQKLDKLIKDGDINSDIFSEINDAKDKDEVETESVKETSEDNNDKNEIDEYEEDSDKEDFDYVDNEGAYDINKHFEKEDKEISPENIYKQYGMTINPYQYGMQGWQGWQYQ